VRKLQISLPDFRKLGIWKGVYLREPRNKKKVSKSSSAAATFYYTKDIQYLHEPLLQKFREQKALEKKISRALGRRDVHDAQWLEQNASRPEMTGKTKYTLDHVIRERYPTFIDALRDLDDCLSMLFLFANLPSTSAVPDLVYFFVTSPLCLVAEAIPSNQFARDPYPIYLFFMWPASPIDCQQREAIEACSFQVLRQRVRHSQELCIVILIYKLLSFS